MANDAPNNATIVEIWDELEGEFPEKSTEFLMQMTCDVYQQRHGQKIDHGHVAAALGEVYDNG